MGSISKKARIRHFNRVVVIDDDFVFRTCFEILLKSEDFSQDILQFENGQEALEAIQQWASDGERFPDLVFLDINMPMMDGWQFLDEIQKLPSEIRNELPIFVLSSSIDPRDLSRSGEYEEVMGYIAKPLTRENLLYVSQHFVEEE